MTIQHQDDGTKGVFYIEINNKPQALLNYTWSGIDKFIINHTEVKTTITERGIGKKLVQSAVDFARERKVKIIPLCAFANKIFSNDGEYADVVYK